MILLSDTDFLSSFLKISQLETVRNFYQTEHLFIAPGVYQELSRTDLVTQIDDLEWVVVRPVSEMELTGYRDEGEFARLGRGEQETIALAGGLKATVLMSDQRALRFARERGIEVIDIPGFLLACKESVFLSIEQIGGMIQALRDEDRYEFRVEVRPPPRSMKSVTGIGDPSEHLTDENFRATRQGWSKRKGGCNASMKLCLSSSRCESCPAKDDPAQAGS